jgi:hypothetical protein
MRRGSDGATLDVGRKTRTIPPAIRRALATRDRQCRFPGCQARRCDAHHVDHWADGGATRLDNLLLLCRRHHRLVHEGGVTVAIDVDGAAHFTLRNGHHLASSPPLLLDTVALEEGLTAVVARAWCGATRRERLRRACARSTGPQPWTRVLRVPDTVHLKMDRSTSNARDRARGLRLRRETPPRYI